MTLLDAGIQLGLGFLVGAFGTLIGAGGGFLLVPLLVLGYHLPRQMPWGRRWLWSA